jgi:hypothetical protein
MEDEPQQEQFRSVAAAGEAGPQNQPARLPPENRTAQLGQQREIVTDLAYTMDGAPCKNVIRGEEFTGTAQWEGDTLLIESKREVQGMEIIQRERWTLSADGQTLTIGNHIQTPQGAFDITIVLEKQLSS